MIKLRKFPYPYKAMITISNDIDHCSIESFETLHRYINDELGLDIADSFFFYIARGLKWDMSYFYNISNKPKHKHAILEYITKGWIDSLHTYGCFSEMGGFSRELAKTIIEEMEKEQIQIDTWIDHGDKFNRQNFGVNRNRFALLSSGLGGEGDNPNDLAYHTDLLLDYGIKFIWSEYRQQPVKQAIQPYTLRDGQKVWGFPRYTLHWQADEIHKQITPGLLAFIKQTNSYCIFANHLGNKYRFWGKITDKMRQVFELLKQEHDTGQILVCRLSRLLRYNLAQLCTDYTYDKQENILRILCIHDKVRGSFIPSLDDIRGLTFEGTAINEDTKIFVGSEEIPSIYIDSKIMIPWYPDSSFPIPKQELIHQWS